MKPNTQTELERLQVVYHAARDVWAVTSAAADAACAARDAAWNAASDAWDAWDAARSEK